MAKVDYTNYPAGMLLKVINDELGYPVGTIFKLLDLDDVEVRATAPDGREQSWYNDRLLGEEGRYGGRYTKCFEPVKKKITVII